MKIVVAPNAFKGSLDVLSVCRAMHEGVVAFDPEVEVVLLPMSDGGDGLCDVMSFLNTRLSARQCDVLDALGRGRTADYLWDESEKLAVIESAKANGIALIEERERDVLRTTSYGVGQLVAHALDAGARHIVVGAGGSASVDGGLGCLQALGVRIQTTGCESTLVPGAYSRIRHIDVAPARRRVGDVKITLLCDVKVPLRQGWKLFAPQKGASESDMRALEVGLQRVRAALGDDADFYWNGNRGGAAGGLTAALALLGAQLHDGAEWVAERVGLHAALASADLVLTGEGSFDATSLVGKAPGCVLRAANACRVPVAVVAGHIEKSAISASSDSDIVLLGLTALTDLNEAMTQPSRWIREATRHALDRALGASRAI